MRNLQFFTCTTCHTLPHVAKKWCVATRKKLQVHATRATCVYRHVACGMQIVWLKVGQLARFYKLVNFYNSAKTGGEMGVESRSPILAAAKTIVLLLFP